MRRRRSPASEFEDAVEAGHARPRPRSDPPSRQLQHLGERVGQILSLAEEEPRELRERAQAEAEETRKLADQAAVSIRDEADQYADQRRRDADTEAAQILADARRAADEERDAAERDAAATAAGG